MSAGAPARVRVSTTTAALIQQGLNARLPTVVDGFAGLNQWRGLIAGGTHQRSRIGIDEHHQWSAHASGQANSLDQRHLRRLELAVENDEYRLHEHSLLSRSTCVQTTLATQAWAVEDFHLATLYPNQSLLLEPGKYAADRFDGETEIIGDVVA